MRIILPVACFLLCLFSCKTKTTSSKAFDPFPSTANLPYSAFSALLAEGTDLYAYSQEAGWRLRIDLGNRAIFTGADGAERVFNFGPGYPDHTSLEEPFVFHDGTYTMQVKFTAADCDDPVNGYTSFYQVEVTMNEVFYKGCGINVFDKRVNGTWKLASIGNTPVYKDTRQQTVFYIDADRGTAARIFLCDSTPYRAVFRSGSIALERGITASLPACKAKGNDALDENFNGFKTYSFQDDTVLVLQGADERSFRFFRQ